MTVEELISKLESFPPYYEVADVVSADISSDGHVYLRSEHYYAPNDTSDYDTDFDSDD